MLFRERQYFVKQWWPLLLGPAVVIPTLLFLVPSHGQGVSMSWPGVLGSLIALLGMGLLLSLRLDTRLDETGVHYRLFPLQWRGQFRPWSEVAQASVRSYDPLGEYGGWGLKGSARNRAYNIGGDQGLQLELTDGRRLLLGTRRPAEVTQALQQLHASGHNASAVR